MYLIEFKKLVLLYFDEFSAHPPGWGMQQSLRSIAVVSASSTTLGVYQDFSDATALPITELQCSIN